VELAALDALAGEVGHPRYRWRPLLAKAMRAMMAGRYDDAERLRAEAAALGSRTDDPNFPVVHLMQGFGLALDRGQEAELRAVGARFVEVMSAFPGAGTWRPVMTAIGAVRAGMLDEARAAWAQVPAGHPLLLGETLMCLLAGEVAAVLGEGELGAQFEPRLARSAGQHLTLGQMGLTWLGPIDRVRGLLAALRGGFDEAEAHLKGALVQARAVGGAPFVARIERELAALDAKRGAPAARVAQNETKQPLTMTAEGDVWVLAYAGRVVRLRASRGLAMLAQLIAEPGRELHALDLGGGSGPGIDTGDAGPLLDAQARAAYRGRYEDLEDAIANAEADNDPARAEKARAELDMLADELSRGVGLGGRERRAGAAAERARVNVQRRLKDALERIAAADPELGRHLSRSVRTGTFCCYEP